MNWLLLRVALLQLLLVYLARDMTAKHPVAQPPMVAKLSDVRHSAVLMAQPYGGRDRYVFLQDGTQRYVDEFESQYRIRVNPSFRVSSLAVRFADRYENKADSSEIIGMCEWSPVPQVTLLKPWWDKASESQREALVFHELGHCLLNERHRDDKPSLMNPFLLRTDQYDGASRDGYIDELFSHGRPNRIDVGATRCAGPR